MTMILPIKLIGTYYVGSITILNLVFKEREKKKK